MYKMARLSENEEKTLRENLRVEQETDESRKNIIKKLPKFRQELGKHPNEH